MAPPISIKLRCNSWKQLAALYKRDLRRSAVFLKSSAPPPLETAVRIMLTLPTQERVDLSGVVREHIPPGGLNGRGPGVDIGLEQIPDETMAKIQAALDRRPADAGASSRASTAEPTAAGTTPRASTAEPAVASDDPAPATAASADPAPAADESPAPTPPPRPSTPPPLPPRKATPPPLPPQLRKQPQAVSDDLLDALDDDIVPLDDITELPPDDEDEAGDAAAAAPAAEASPAAEAPAPDSSGDPDLVARLEQERESLRKLNPFQILGVGYETTDEAVQEAFASLSERYHPGRFADGHDPAAQAIATDIFALIRDAHLMLRSSAARQLVKNQLSGAARPVSAPASEEPPAAAADIAIDDSDAAQQPASDSPADQDNQDPEPADAAVQDSADATGDSAPTSEQDEIPTKPVMVDEVGMPMSPSGRAADGEGVPDQPQEERPTAPAPISDDAAAQPPASAADDLLAADPAEVAADPGPAAADSAEVAADPGPAAADPADAPPADSGVDNDAVADFNQDPLAGLDEALAAPDPAPADAADDAEPAASDAPVGLLDEDPLAGDDLGPAGEPEPPPAQAGDPALGLAGDARFAEAFPLIEAGQYKEAASVYKAVKRRDPGDTGARVGLELSEGLRFMAVRDRLEAGQRFEAVLEMDPDNDRAKAELAEIRRQVAEERQKVLSRLREQQE